MKGSHEVAALFHQHRVALVGRQYVSLWPHAANDRRTNEHGFEFAGMRALLEFRLGCKVSDTAVDLAAIAVSLYCQIHQSQTLLRRVSDFAGQQDSPGAGAEDGPAAAEIRQGARTGFRWPSASAWWCFRRRGSRAHPASRGRRLCGQAPAQLPRAREPGCALRNRPGAPAPRPSSSTSPGFAAAPIPAISRYRSRASRFPDSSLASSSFCGSLK